jgi:hypothetical protein
MPTRNSLTRTAAIEDVDRLFDVQLEAARAGRLDEVRRLILQLDRAKQRLRKLGGEKKWTPVRVPLFFSL